MIKVKDRHPPDTMRHMAHVIYIIPLLKGVQRNGDNKNFTVFQLIWLLDAYSWHATYK